MTTVRAMAAVTGKEVVIIRCYIKQELVAKIVFNRTTFFFQSILIIVIKENSRSRISTMSTSNSGNG